MYSKEHLMYLKKIKLNKLLVHLTQIIILVTIIILWEFLSTNNYINSFIYSSPSRIINTIVNLYQENNLFNHIWITIYETIISFTLATIIGTIIAILLWYSKFLFNVVDPYLTILNSLPKVSLGPIIIIICGANIKSIIIMALLISLIITISNVYNGFINTDNNKIKLLQSFGATKWQILINLVIPANYHIIINALKINVSMTLIGVIMGELLVSKQGIGYLINYGSQVFNLNLVFSGIIILIIVSYLMYLIVASLEKLLIKNK